MYHSVHPKQQGFELFLQRHISSRQVAYADWDAIKKRTFGDTLLSWLFSTQNCSLSLSFHLLLLLLPAHNTAKQNSNSVDEQEQRQFFEDGNYFNQHFKY